MTFCSACIRLFLLIRTGGCMLVQQTIPQRDVLLGRSDNGPMRRSPPWPPRCCLSLARPLMLLRLLAELIRIARPLIYRPSPPILIYYHLLSAPLTIDASYPHFCCGC